MSVVALIVPATSAASSSSDSSTSSSEVPAAIVAKAEAVGEPGVLLKYSPATDSWSEVAAVDQPFASALTTDTAAEPEIAGKAKLACLLLTWSIGVCNDTAVVYQDVVPNTAAKIIKSLETVNEDDLEQTKVTYENWLKLNHILQGSNDTASDEAEGGYEDAAGDGAEDDAIDFGGDFVDVVIDVLLW